MQRVSGLTDRLDFASHGRDIFLALHSASPSPLFEYPSILDFGIGSGRLARMFKGFRGRYTGADIDHELLEWAGTHLPWVAPMATTPRAPLPARDASFDCVISISVFTHMSEADSLFYLDELHRVTKPGATLLLTVHGERALKRAETESDIFEMLSIPRAKLEGARSAMPGFSFILQQGHLTSDAYEYGISFTGEQYVHTEWAKRFQVNRVVSGAIHDFQDIVVLKRT
ncbi:hypothetical protein ASE63_22505 [Bosea sp. Root381]|nr:hypothetical protein ASE63_22505 [Bosea sp. Root381]